MILKTIIDRLNQRVEVSNIFDRIYGLCELTGDKGWIYYIGEGQAIPVTDYDSKQGSLFWAKRGKVNISKIDSLKVSGCKQMYSTKFNLSAYAIVRKSHLPCDGEDAGDWVASRVYKLVSGRDYGFKEVIDVVSYEVIPNGYTVGDKSLPPNFEFATVVIDLEVEIVSGSEDTCYDICNTGDIPLPPDFLPCTPCLTEVAVDGVTIIGNGTPSDPLIAVGGGGGGSLTVRDEGTVVATGVVNMNFRGGAVNANSTTPGSVNIDVQEVQLTAGTGISVSGTYPSLTITNTAPSSGGTVTSVSASVPSPASPALSVLVSNPTTTPAIAITANGTTSQYVRGDGSLDTFPTLTGYVPYTGATNDVNLGTFNLTADHIALNTNPSGAGFVEGATQWNNTIGSSETLLKGGNVTLKNGVDLVARIVNKVTPNTTLTKAAYQAVRVSGATGGRLSIELAQANTDNNSADTIGLVTETINPNQEGFIMTVGQLLDINTTGSLQGESWSDGDVLYLSPTTAGQLTNIKPTGTTGHIVVMGYVEYAHPNQGSIYVKVMNGWELDELHNVYINVPANNDALIYESSTQLWKNKSIATALGYTPVATTRTISTSSPLSGGGDLSADRTLSIADADADGTTKGAAAFTASDFNASAGVISIDYTNGQAASGSTKGFLTSADWTTFNGKFNTPSGTTSQYVRGDGSLATFPTGIPVVYRSTTDGTASNAALNTLSASQLVPANTFAVGDTIRVTARARKVGATGNLSLRIYANTSNSLTGATLLGTFVSTGLMIPIQRHLAIKSATNTEGHSATTSLVSDISPSSVAVTSSNIDWTQAQYIIFAVQNGASADSSLISYYTIEKL